MRTLAGGATSPTGRCFVRLAARMAGRVPARAPLALPVRATGCQALQVPCMRLQAISFGVYMQCTGTPSSPSAGRVLLHARARCRRALCVSSQPGAHSTDVDFACRGTEGRVDSKQVEDFPRHLTCT